jgi:hypothetical protein
LWLRTWTVLGLMHWLDDQAKERITEGPYYGLRAASDDGLTLAALTMVRDLAHHGDHRVQPALVHRGMELLAAVEGGLVPLKVSAVGDGGLVDLEVTAPSVLWRPYAELPPWPGRGTDCTTGTPTTSGALRDGASWSRSGPPSASWPVSSSRRTAGNRYRSSVSDAFEGTRARRQAFMARLCEALGPVVGPRITLEAHGGRGIAVLLDGGRGGTFATRAAPWFPSPTPRRDLIRTARGVAEAVHHALSEEWMMATTSIGPSRPSVTARETLVAIHFFGVNGEPLRVIEISLPVTGG